MTAGPHAALEAHDLSITARIDKEQRVIVEPLSLSLAPGETLGLVGESGSGKSLIARALVDLLPPGVSRSGVVRVHGTTMGAPADFERAHGREVALVLQDPFTMLHPLLRCGVHVEECLSIPGGSRGARARARAETARRLEEVGIRAADVQDRYPFELSGGMRQRVALAAALARDPSVLIADEPSTALDSTTQEEVLDLLRSLQASRGMALLLITHDLRLAFSICHRVMVLYAGSIMEVGPAPAVHREPAHPYTLALLLSEPPVDKRVETLHITEGAVPRAGDVSGQCGFAARCHWAQAMCVAAKPALRTTNDGRQSACVRLTDVAQVMSAERARAARAGLPDSIPHEPVVTVDGVTKVYTRRRGRDAVTALERMSMYVSAGETVGIVGESGSGKTTIGRCIVGLESVTSGTVTIDGVDASDYSGMTQADRVHVRGTVAMVFQDPYSTLNPARTIGSVLREVLRHRTPAPADVDAELERVLALVSLPLEYAARKPSALSGGERQRVAIARALAIRPKVVICDEAVSALDVSVQAQVIDLLRRLQAELGLSYVFITHDLAVVRQIAHRVYVMHKGMVVESGEVADVLDRPKHPYTTRLIHSVPGRHEAPEVPERSAAAHHCGHLTDVGSCAS